MYKCFSLFALFCTCAIALQAQYGFSLTNVEFSGTNGRVFKPALVPAVHFSFDEIDDHFQVNASIGFSILPTRQDTFFSAGVRVDGQATILPSFEIYQQVKYIPLSITYSYIPLESNLRPVFGLAINADILIYNYEKETATVISSTEQNKDYMLIGGLPFVGGSYQLNDQLRCQLHVGRQFAIDSNKAWQRLWRTSLSAFYYFK